MLSNRPKKWEIDFEKVPGSGLEIREPGNGGDQKTVVHRIVRTIISKVTH